MKKRFLAVFMSLCMMLGAVPLTAFAGDGTGEEAVCSCEEPCTEENVNEDCGVCAGDYIECEAEKPLACICEEACTEESINKDCPLCIEDYAKCIVQNNEPIEDNKKDDDSEDDVIYKEKEDDLKEYKTDETDSLSLYNFDAPGTSADNPIEVPASGLAFNNGVVYGISQEWYKEKKKEITGSEDVEENRDFKLYVSVVIPSEIDGKAVKTIGFNSFTNSFAKRYFKLVHISGITNAEVHYQVQNSQVDIDYSLEIPKGSNILSKFGNIDNISVDRLISAHTVKNGDSIKISEYKYEFLQSDKSKLLLLKGNGLFTKLSGSYKPVYFTLKTNEKVNLSLIKSFIRNTLQGGYFTADLKCDFLKKKVTGFLNVYKTSFKNVLCLDNVNVLLSENLVKINADGTFYDSPICLDFSADNNFDDIMIHNIDIILERFYIKRGNSVSTKSFIVHNEINKNLNLEQNMTIKKGRIHVKEIASSKFKLHNVEMLADMHNGLVRFTIPQTAYAKGILTASGKYNLFNHSSDINFAASDIDSNEVASSLFNLHDQIEGSAFATLHLITLNKLNDIKAYATFAVNDGSLPKLGSKEFIISGSKTHKVLFFLKKPFKFTLSKISNIDFSNPDIVSSDLNGSFFLDNNDIKNVKIFSKNEFLSLFIEGNYNIVNENGRLYIWGRHNRIEEKKIKIFKIPLSFIYKIVFRKEKSKHLYQDKIKQIPSINAKPEEEALFRVFVNGNINTNDVKVILKDLK